VSRATAAMRTISKQQATQHATQHATWRFALPMTMVIVAAVTEISGQEFQAQYDPQSLRAVAVHVLQDPAQSWTGYGIYLRDGLVITAAHVVGAKSSIRIAGQVLPATVLKESPFEKDDLALLGFEGASLPVSLRLRRTSLCVDAPIVDEPVFVAIPEETASSHIMSPERLPRRYQARFASVISDVATTGNSGSGVFRAGRRCLLGIMSRKIQVRQNGNSSSELKDLAKYFVPASVILPFLPAEYR
jgi:hypothetical protein